MKNYCRNKKRTINLVGLQVPYLVFVGGIAASALIVFMTIQTVTASAKLSFLESEEYELLKKNQELNNSLIENSSLVSLSKNAESLGFIKPAKFIYSEKESEVAKLP